MIGNFVYAPPTDPYLDVVHNDDDILVLNKPSGLLTVPGKAAEHSDCLEKRAQEKFPSATIVHRLDMDTSGIIIMAMHRSAHRHLGLQFERRHTAKTYIADVFGCMQDDQGTVDLPLRCDWPNRPRQMVDHEEGRSAQTGWQALERFENHTRVELTPITGRTHQLRVHMLELGHPILGDRFYATGDALDAADRLRLHAKSLTLHHPTGGKRVTFNAALPF
ncbi:RluA family pseudouridine synthase [Maritalea sp.]|uniref:RluA family pseudouridine synthase n=1 Tax=Maritalea sp. TaxID=2003361 RepID=UPI003EF27E8B